MCANSGSVGSTNCNYCLTLSQHPLLQFSVRYSVRFPVEMPVRNSIGCGLSHCVGFLVRLEVEFDEQEEVAG